MASERNELIDDAGCSTEDAAAASRTPKAELEVSTQSAPPLRDQAAQQEEEKVHEEEAVQKEEDEEKTSSPKKVHFSDQVGFRLNIFCTYARMRITLK